MSLEFQSNSIPKCFWVTDWVTAFLSKLNVGWVDFWSLREKITSWACLLEPELKLIFHWKAQLFILFKSWFSSFVDKCLSFITEKSDVSSVNSLGFKVKFSGTSFIYIKKMDLELNFEGHLLQHLLILIVEHLRLLFISYHLEN